jgi:hypothetical protein
MVATTFLFLIILLCYVNKLNTSMSNFGGRLDQPKKNETYSKDFFFLCQHNSTGGGFLILKQIIHGFNSLFNQFFFLLINIV